MEPTPIHLGNHCGTWHVQREWYQNWPLAQKIGSGIGRPIVTKFGTYVIGDQAAMYVTQVICSEHLHVRTCRCASFPYLGSGWRDCGEIWCVVRDSLARRLQKYTVGTSVRAHVQMCPFCNSESAGRIELKFGMWLVTH